MTATHIPVGKPANNSESRVFKHLKESLPDGYTLLTNVRINQGGHGFDFDAILLGKHAIYVIEIKIWAGLFAGIISIGRWSMMTVLFSLPQRIRWLRRRCRRVFLAEI
ncbi:MAG: NERD domain-containing protein [Anaerolineales bacterium]|nr:NERD domain-containing protein [Anaerolineales bacterium]